MNKLTDPQHSNKWWRASYSWRYEITPVEVVKELPETLLILERHGWNNDKPPVEARVKKSSSQTRYFPTWQEAHVHLLEVAENRLQHARRSLEKAQSEYGNVKGMRAPSEGKEDE